MKIAEVNTFFHPVIGGVESYVRDLSKELAKRGHEVHVFTVRKRHGTPLGPSEERLDGISVHRLPAVIDLSYRLKIWPSLIGRLLDENFDVVHTYCQGNFPTVASALVRRLRGTPLIITTYGPLRTQAAYPAFKKLPLELYDGFVTRMIFNAADMVFARNPLIIPWLESLGIGKEKIEVSPSWLPEECLTLRSGKIFRNKHKLNGNEIVLYVGRINPQKGVQYLVRSAPLVLEKIPNAVFVFIGPDEIGYAGRLMELGEKLGIKDRIRVCSPVQDIDEELEAYAACDVFVMPSSFEGFGQAVLKAMAQGKPVVATRVGGLPYLVRNGLDGLLIDYGNETQLAEATIKLLSESTLAQKLGFEARERAKNFAHETSVDKVESTYRSLCRKEC